MTDRLRDFEDIDRDSQSFRYAKDQNGQQLWLTGEFWVSFEHLRTTIDVWVNGFEKAHFTIGK